MKCSRVEYDDERLVDHERQIGTHACSPSRRRFVLSSTKWLMGTNNYLSRLRLKPTQTRQLLLSFRSANVHIFFSSSSVVSFFNVGFGPDRRVVA